MSTEKQEWRPDDTFHDMVDGEFKGVLRVKNALESLGIKLGDKIVTSRDLEIVQVFEKLRRDHLPNGFRQWQLPIILGGGNRPVMSFITFGEPRAHIPYHTHRNDCLLRVVLTGSILYKSTELTTGDWMYVPIGHGYSFTAGPMGCVIMHMYNGSGLYPGTSLPKPL